MYIAQKKLKKDFNILFTVTLTLIIVGILFIYSSSSVFALEKHGSALYFVKKQLIGLLAGALGYALFRYVPLETIKKSSPYFFIGSLFLTALTVISSFGHKIHGSSRWLQLGKVGLQPSELLKVSLILYAAYFLTKKEKMHPTIWQTYIPLLVIIGLPSILLLKQPDFGMTVTLACTTLIMFFVIHFNLMYIAISVAALVPLTLSLIYFQPYRLQRIMTFLNPWADPQGSGFQIIQSLIAIGSGSFLGTGVAHSKQKFFYLPMQHTDFIFSIIAEETGFIGSVLLIALYIIFLYYGIAIALRLQSLFCSLATLGFIVVTSLQTVMNLAVVTGLVPTKGVGLPFVSYGNSALVCGLCMIGFISNCVNQPQNY